MLSLCSQSRRQFAISHLRCNAFGTPATFAHFPLPTPPSPPSSTPRRRPPDARRPSPTPTARPSHRPSPLRFPRPMASGPPGSMSLSAADAQPSTDPSWEGDRMSVFLISPHRSPAHPCIPPGSIFIYTTTATNVASAKPPASSSQKPRYRQTLPPQSTPSRASCSSPFHAFSCRLAPSQLVRFPQVVECLLGAFHSQEQWLRNRGRYGLHPGTYTDYRPTSSPCQRIPSPAPAPNSTG